MQWDYYQELAQSTDVFIGVGTSGRVEPAATLLSVFLPAKNRYFIDPDPMQGLHAYELLKGTACEHLPILAKSLIERLGEDL
jgi:NAD-dependent SIR2 family protein deacetylase